MALYSQHPTEWSEENDYELIADARENVWVVELGDRERFGSFQAFVDAILAATGTANERVEYDSPSLGTVAVGWEGPMTVNGAEVDLGPYDRWDNPYCRQAFGTNVTRIEFNGQRLELDFSAPARRCMETP